MSVRHGRGAPVQGPRLAPPLVLLFHLNRPIRHTRNILIFTVSKLKTFHYYTLLWTESLLSILLLSTCPPQLLDIGTSRMSFGGGNVSLSSPNMSRPMESLSPLISSLSLFLWNLGGRLDLTAADLGLPDGGFPLGSHKSSLL